MAGSFFDYCKRITIGLLILFICNTALFSQIIINDYAKVLSVSDYTVTVDDPSKFNPDEFVLLIQMKGVSINKDDGTGYGDIADIVGIPGQYEFLKINAKVGSTISFLSKIKKYDASGFAQLIRVPFYTSFDVNQELTCKPWSETDGTGGVFAVINGGTLKLSANIDVSKKGFAGAVDDPVEGLGDCSFATGITGVYSFITSFQNAGFKGEGNASHYTPFTGAAAVLLPAGLKGQGPLFSGGGGGNGRFSGGGGGSNRGIGSIGGDEDYYCSPSIWFGGRPGLSVKPDIDIVSFTGGVFMGGGGGSSTHKAGAASTSGGNGGGIVFIISESIDANGHSIIASGDSARTATGIFSGAGGGGAGGSVIIFSQNYSSSDLNIKVNGSKGGDAFHSWLTSEGGGVGGGGGGGYIALLKPITGNVNVDLAGGGQSFVKYTGFPRDAVASSGSPGLLRDGVNPVLTGFLYNSISSQVTGTQTDSVCELAASSSIIGTNPIGGVPPYTCEWYSSTVSESSGFITTGVTTKDYSPGILTQTTWFKRIVKDSGVGVSQITDESRPVKFIFQPAITKNFVGKDTTICFGQNPLSLLPLNTGPSNGSSFNYYYYRWLQNNTNTDWNTSPAATGKADTTFYDPPVLTVSGKFYYKRVVTSGRCIDYSSTVTITVLDTIKNNKILNSPPDICYGTTFTDLTATTSPALNGGDNAYRFKWESNINGSGWSLAAGVNNGSDYNPLEQPQRIPSNQYLFRRVVYSGIHDVCRDTSNVKLLKDFPVITGNSIAPVPPVCSGSKPLDITGSKTPTLAGGNTSYIFSWKDSTKTHSWMVISGASSPDLPTTVLTDTTWYHRIVRAVCADTSNKIRVIVHKPILNNTISVLTGGVTQTICNNQTPVSITGSAPAGGTNIPGDFAYLWKSSPDNSVFNPVSGATGINYPPPSLTAATYYYKREVTSGACVVLSNPITIAVHPDITNNTITGKSKVCYGLKPDPITGGILSGGSGIYSYLWEQSINGGTTWTPAGLTNNSPDYQPDSLKSPVKYRRTVTSGLGNCCSSVSNSFDIGIDPMPSIPNPGPDSIIFSIEKLYTMKAIDPSLTGDIGTWKTMNNGTGITDDASRFNSIVRNLSPGKNSFLWTVGKGPCKLKDSVDIVLLDDFIPQGFSPNGDLWNNTFKIEGLNFEDQIVDFSIVNGVGTEIYAFHGQGDDIKSWKGWDGTNLNGNNLPEGTYYYLLKLTSDSTKGGNGKVFRKKGFIILKRY